jgi:hypothetical protein
MDRLFKLRLVVARVGEMDLAGWWNTQGQLGSLGTSVLKRGFRRTHYFAQARSVFAVATQRCAELYERKGSVTLWGLPAELEDALEMHWERWLEAAEDWRTFFAGLEACSADLAMELRRFDLVTDEHVERVSRLRRSAEQRAVQLPGEFRGSDDDLTMLALAFSRGDRASPAVPFQLWSGQP